MLFIHHLNNIIYIFFIYAGRRSFGLLLYILDFGARGIIEHPVC